MVRVRSRAAAGLSASSIVIGSSADDAGSTEPTIAACGEPFARSARQASARTGDGGEQPARRLRVEQHRVERVRGRLLEIADRAAQPHVLRLQGRENPLGERLARALEQRHGGETEAYVDAEARTISTRWPISRTPSRR